MNPMLLLVFYLYGCEKDTNDLSNISKVEDQRLLNEVLPLEGDYAQIQSHPKEPAVGDAAINDIVGREHLAKLWYQAAQTNETQNPENIELLETVSLEAIKAEIMLDKSACFLLAYSYRLRGKLKNKTKS
jgi:hypothetical protein